MLIGRGLWGRCRAGGPKRRRFSLCAVYWVLCRRRIWVAADCVRSFAAFEEFEEAHSCALTGIGQRWRHRAGSGRMGWTCVEHLRRTGCYDRGAQMQTLPRQRFLCERFLCGLGNRNSQVVVAEGDLGALRPMSKCHWPSLV